MLRYFTIENGSAECNVCRVMLAFKSSSYVTGLVYHLKNRPGHEDEYQEYCMKKEEHQLERNIQYQRFMLPFSIRK